MFDVEFGVWLVLVVILVGEDFVSMIYVGCKFKVCVKVGIGLLVYWLFDYVFEVDFLVLIDWFNCDLVVYGVFV